MFLFECPMGRMFFILIRNSGSLFYYKSGQRVLQIAEELLQIGTGLS